MVLVEVEEVLVLVEVVVPVVVLVELEEVLDDVVEVEVVV
jgi:hypothetical protein